MLSASHGAKRALELVAATLALVLQLPLVPIVALAIVVESRGPVFVLRPAVGVQLRRPRAGRDVSDHPRRVHDVGGALLRLPEYRLTTVPRDGQPARLTRVGRLLRRTRLAQGPRFLSVLLGDLALVGTRPLSPQCVAELRARVPGWDALLVGLKPGLFGPAQAQGRLGGGWVAALRDRVLFEVDYAERLSHATRVRDVLALDLSVVRACCARALRSRVPLGHEVIRIDAPSQLQQASVDVRALLRPAGSGLADSGVPRRGPSVELHQHGARLTAFWYPPRHLSLHRSLHRPTVRQPVALGRAAAIDLLHTADEPFEARWVVPEERRDCQLLVVHALRADGATATLPPDELHVDLPGGLHEVARLCEQFLPLWESLGRRRGDDALPNRVTRLMLAGFSRLAAGREDGRITLDVHVAGDRIVLQFTAQLPLPGLTERSEQPLPRMVLAPSLGAVPVMAGMPAALATPAPHRSQPQAHVPVPSPAQTQALNPSRPPFRPH